MDSFWKWFLGIPLQLVIILGIAIVSQAVLGRLVERLTFRAMSTRITRDSEPKTPEEVIERSRRDQRAESITALLRSVIVGLVWSIAGITMLSTIGINVGPLLASAGVVGVALGFGAQTLVKDYLAGIFMIIEDQYGIGDLVDLGQVVGTVEEVGLRVTRLRDMSGVVWYVRNGEILRVANRSQGWTLAIVDVPVSYDSDLDKVRDIIERVADDMTEDPASRELLLDRPEYAGVESVSGEAVIIRVTARAMPDKQVAGSRAIRERLKVAFDEGGVKVPAVLRLPHQPPKA